MTKKAIWVGLVVAAVIALWTVRANVPERTEEPRGGVPQMTRQEVQEFATARWWQSLSRDDQVQVCLASNRAGEGTFKEIAERNELFPNQLWTFIERKCDL